MINIHTTPVLSDEFMKRVEKKLKKEDKKFRKRIKKILRKLNKTTDV